MTDNEVKWLIVGKLLRRNLMAGAGKEPVAYVYGGVELPDIYSVYTPELQKEYPFAIIKYHDGKLGWCLRLCGAVPVYWEERYVVLKDCAMFSGDVAQKYYTLVDGAWIFYKDINANNIGRFSETTWVSCDVLNPDGTVYMSASDPIPIYE